MRKYRIAKNQSFRAGEEIRLEKITTAERVLNGFLWLELIAAILIFIIY